MFAIKAGARTMTTRNLGVATTVLVILTGCGGGSGSEGGNASSGGSNDTSGALSGTSTGAMGVEPASTTGAAGSAGGSLQSGGQSESDQALAPPVGAPRRGNGAPVISGTPELRASAGADYLFQPVASDPDSDSLAFEIRNLPAWAAFDAGTGRIAGRPRSGDKGTFGPITVVVSDGTSMASLPSFEITVDPPGQGQGQVQAKLKLAWRVPDRNEDGTAVAQPPSFRIHYGRRSHEYDQVVALPERGQSRYQFTDLESGIWYLAMTSVGPDGLESELSDEMTASVQ